MPFANNALCLLFAHIGLSKAVMWVVMHGYVVLMSMEKSCVGGCNLMTTEHCWCVAMYSFSRCESVNVCFAVCIVGKMAQDVVMV